MRSEIDIIERRFHIIANGLITTRGLQLEVERAQRVSGNSSLDKSTYINKCIP